MTYDDAKNLRTIGFCLCSAAIWYKIIAYYLFCCKYVLSKKIKVIILILGHTHYNVNTHNVEIIVTM